MKDIYKICQISKFFFSRSSQNTCSLFFHNLVWPHCFKIINSFLTALKFHSFPVLFIFLLSFPRHKFPSTVANKRNSTCAFNRSKKTKSRKEMEVEIRLAASIEESKTGFTATFPTGQDWKIFSSTSLEESFLSMKGHRGEVIREHPLKFETKTSTRLSRFLDDRPANWRLFTANVP